MLLVILKVLIDPLIRTIRDITYPATYSGMKAQDGAELVLLCSVNPLLLHKIFVHVGWQMIVLPICLMHAESPKV